MLFYKRYGTKQTNNKNTANNQTLQKKSITATNQDS